MNRQQRRAAERNLHRKTTLPVHELNKQRAKPSDYAERQYLYARVTATRAEDAPPSENHRNAVWQRHETMINDAVYCRNMGETIARLSQLIIEVELLLRFYDDLDESKPFFTRLHAARAALNAEANLRDGSPNQRRALLKPLYILNDDLRELMGIAPESLLKTISRYTANISIRWANVSFHENIVAATAAIRIINGESLRQVAKSYGMKENLLKELVLNAAEKLCKIAVMFTETAYIQLANSIPELRTPAYKIIAKPEMLKKSSLIALDSCEYFERQFGISASGEVAKAERGLSEKLRKMH